MRTFHLHVNGQVHAVQADPETPLIYILRNDLGLKGVKFGCGLEQCGACKVLIDGEAVPTCRLPVRSLQGREIVTIEGLGTPGRPGAPDHPHPLQQAFAEEQAAQCGFCVPGMIVSAKALLDRNPHPSEGEIKAALAYNLCRCGVHDRAVRAVQRVAGGEPPAAAWSMQAMPPHPEQAETLPSPLLHTPNLDSWIRINADETVTVFTGKAELGQGIKTAIAQIAAEELDVAFERIRVVTAETGRTPDEGYTAGSMSLETSGNAVRLAAAEARRILLAVAYEELEAPVERLVVQDGDIRDPESGRSTTYWKLQGGRPFGVPVNAPPPQKNPADYAVVGQPQARYDLLEKITGRACFVQDLDLPGMVHGRVLRPPAYGARLAACDAARVESLPGVIHVVRDGSFLAVIAGREEQAERALDELARAAEWTYQAHLPDPDGLFADLLSAPAVSSQIVDGAPQEGEIPPVQAPKAAAQTLQAEYSRPYQMHAAIGPSAAVAHWQAGRLTVWTHSQGVYPLRRAMAQVLGMDAADLHVIHLDGPGCFGHNGADDAALDAALLARALPGKPVSVKWSRADEHAWEPYTPAMCLRLQASLDESGEVIDWNHDVWSSPHSGRPRPDNERSGLLAAWHLADASPPLAHKPPGGPHTGEYRNADPLYTFDRRRVVRHFVAEGPLRTSSLRSLGAFANLFAIESFMDELAHAAGEDPLAFRLRYLRDPRARAVLEAAAEKAGWGQQSNGDGRGQGIAFAQYKNRASYSAVVVDLSVDRSSGKVRLERAVIAADSGQIVNPDHLSAQLSGSFIQAASMTLVEQVRYDQYGITSRDWYSYPILRFPDAPRVEVVLLDRPGAPYLGSGEAGPGPAPGAIANAIFAALGVRLREIPFTPARVREALEVQTR